MMTDKYIRVLLDLTDLKTEPFKFVWINVSLQELLTIADFKLSISRKLNIDSTNIKLYVRQGLLLDNESTTVLREDDTIKVQYASQTISEENTGEMTVKENRKSSRKRNYAECITESSATVNKISKDGEILENKNNQEETTFKHKKKKNKQLYCSESEYSCIQSIELETNNLQQLESHKRKNKNLKTTGKKQMDLQFCELFSLNNSECTVDVSNDKSNLNESLKISKSANLLPDPYPVYNDSLSVVNREENKSSLNTVAGENSNSLNIVSSKKKRKRRKRKKVKETTSNITENTNNQSEFKSLLYEVDKRYEGKHVTYSSSPSEEEIVIFENPNRCLSTMQNTTINFPVKIDKKDLGLPAASSTPDNIHNSCKNTFSSQNKEFKTKEKTNSVLSLLKTAPGVGTHVVNKEEIVKSVNFKKEEVEIEPVKHVIKPVGRIGKVENLQENEIPLPEIKKFKNLGLPAASSTPDNTQNSCKNTFNRQNKEFKTEEKTYSELLPLKTRPDVGTYIAYKVLELDDHYSPVISEYREGIVRSVNFKNEEMEIELVKHVIKPGRTGKFENLREGEIPLPEIKKFDTVTWSSMVEPKILP